MTNTTKRGRYVPTDFRTRIYHRRIYESGRYKRPSGNGSVSEDYDSLGGFIIEHLDRLPEVGDEVCTDNGIRLIVEALDKNRVESVRMYLPEKHDADNKSELSSSESAAQTAFTEEK